MAALPFPERGQIPCCDPVELPGRRLMRLSDVVVLPAQNKEYRLRPIDRRPAGAFQFASGPQYIPRDLYFFRRRSDRLSAAARERGEFIARSRSLGGGSV